jgi:tetratricopeptide (TPR) repeat protein
MRRWIVPAVWVLTVGTLSGAAPVGHWFERGNQFYEQGGYDSAAAYYEKIVESGMNNSTVYYNLGNAYFRLKKVGPAILAYEKAQRLDPNDPDIAANIKFANASIVDRLPVPEKGFVEAALWRVHTLFPLGTQLWLVFAGLLLLSGFFSIGLFSSRNVRLWMVYLSSLTAAVVLVEGVSLGYKIYHEESAVYAVVLTSSTDALSEPNGSKVLFTIHEGTKLRMRKSLDQWALVSLPNGVSGWIESSALGRI